MKIIFEKLELICSNMILKQNEIESGGILFSVTLINNDCTAFFISKSYKSTKHIMLNQSLILFLFLKKKYFHKTIIIIHDLKN